MVGGIGWYSAKKYPLQILEIKYVLILLYKNKNWLLFLKILNPRTNDVSASAFQRQRLLLQQGMGDEVYGKLWNGKREDG